jgi:hypothetical protein
MADGADIQNDFTKGWTDKMVEYHQDLVTRCRQHAWMHFRAETHYNRLFWALAIPSTLLNVVIGSVGLVTISEIVADPLWYVFVTLFCLNIVLGFLNGMTSLLEPNITAKDHRGTAAEFVELANWITLQLSTDIHYRDHCDSVSRVASVRYSNLLSNSAMEPNSTTKELLAILEDGATLPEQAMPPTENYAQGVSYRIDREMLNQSQTDSVTLDILPPTPPEEP